jgi:hypothetical protein
MTGAPRWRGRSRRPSPDRPTRSFARTLASVSETDLSFASLEPDGGERLQPLRRQLGVSTFGLNVIVLLALGGDGEHHGRDGRAWSGWEEGGEGRPPAEVSLPEDLPGPDGR